MAAPFSKPSVLLINPPVFDFAFYDLFVKPYGLFRIGHWLGETGYDIHIIDAMDYNDSISVSRMGVCQRKENGTGKIFRQAVDLPPHIQSIPRQFSRYGVMRESLEAQMRALPEPPDLILITTGMTYWYLGVQEMVRLSRKVFPSVPVGCGGIYASLMPEHCREVCEADFVTIGSAWPGMVKDLESLGLPVPRKAPSLYPLTNSTVWNNSAVLRLNEGCPFSCDYCASSLLCPSFKKGCSQDAFDFVMKLFNDRNCRNFAFYDDALLVDWDDVLKPFLQAVTDQMRTSGFGVDEAIRFYNPNALHIRYLDSEKLNLLRQSGFQEVRMGYESFDDDFHNQRDGKSSQWEFRRAIDAVKESEFPLERCQVYILAGLPGQKAEDVETSIRSAASTGVRCRIASYSPVPGTVLWEESLRHSPYPLEKEPLYHNNSFFPLEWEGLNRKKMDELRRLGLELFNQRCQ